MPCGLRSWHARSTRHGPRGGSHYKTPSSCDGGVITAQALLDETATHAGTPSGPTSLAIAPVDLPPARRGPAADALKNSHGGGVLLLSHGGGVTSSLCFR